MKETIVLSKENKEYLEKRFPFLREKLKKGAERIESVEIDHDGNQFNPDDIPLTMYIERGEGEGFIAMEKRVIYVLHSGKMISHTQRRDIQINKKFEKSSYNEGNSISTVLKSINPNAVKWIMIEKEVTVMEDNRYEPNRVIMMTLIPMKSVIDKIH
jgi:hypothetical protein